jgi:hypothetical protein
MTQTDEPLHVQDQSQFMKTIKKNRINKLGNVYITKSKPQNHEETVEYGGKSQQ